MNVGDLVRLKSDFPSRFGGKEGIIIHRGLEILPNGTDRILVYKLLVDGIIINVPLKWMVRINTHPEHRRNK
jgi:hypothetical protein